MLIFHLICAVLLIAFGFGLFYWSRTTRTTYWKKEPERRYANSVAVLSIVLEAWLAAVFFLPMNALFLGLIVALLALYRTCYWYEQILDEKAHAFVA